MSKQKIAKEEQAVLDMLAVNESVDEILENFNRNIDTLGEPDWVAEPEQ